MNKRKPTSQGSVNRNEWITPILVVGGIFLILLGCVFCPDLQYAAKGPEALALKIDRILDKEKPLFITEESLVQYWPKEVAPYFGYEMLTNGDPKTPIVSFFDSDDPFQCFHVLGFTFTFDDSGKIFLNGRYRNPVSPRYQSIEALVTLVHETAHIQGGDFSGMDPQTCEKVTHLAALEVLAAMANHGNKYARQALLTEVRDICTGVVMLKGIKSGDMAPYKRLIGLIKGKGDNKSLRRWQQTGLDKLEDILSKYSATVYDDWQDFQFTASAEGDKSPRTFIMDDLKAFLENL